MRVHSLEHSGVEETMGSLMANPSALATELPETDRDLVLRDRDLVLADSWVGGGIPPWEVLPQRGQNLAAARQWSGNGSGMARQWQGNGTAIIGQWQGSLPLHLTQHFAPHEAAGGISSQARPDNLAELGRHSPIIVLSFPHHSAAIAAPFPYPSPAVALPLSCHSLPVALPVLCPSQSCMLLAR